MKIKFSAFLTKNSLDNSKGFILEFFCSSGRDFPPALRDLNFSKRRKEKQAKIRKKDQEKSRKRMKKLSAS